MKKFQRKIENFVCENCETVVKGDGYTNHCPKCFWSKHVDINPGDRGEKCAGMMKPTKVLFKNGSNVVVHKCLKCAFKRSNKINKKDDFDALIKISSSYDIGID